MGNRLSKISTKTGDDGTSALGDGTRLPKSDLRFDAMGVVDSLNAHIGLLQAHLATDTATGANTDFAAIHDELSLIQHKLFNIGGEIALPNHAKIGYVAISGDDVEALEDWLESKNANLPYLKDFILPAGSVATASAHVARALCRDAERVLVSLSERDGNIRAESLMYLNRLSDYLFVIARVIVRHDRAHLDGAEVLWQK